MLYMTPHTGTIAAYPPYWGVIMTPSRRGQNVAPGRAWCGDNEAFAGRFEPGRFFSWLEAMLPYRERCLFVVAPDSVGNPYQTRTLWIEHAWRIKALGYPVAFVAQDGQESLPFPPDYDALFVGGSTDWKLSDAADWCIRQAKARGAWVHVGRVNSQTRIRHFQLIGVDSVDGTGLAINPSQNFRVLDNQLRQPSLFTGACL